MKDIKTLRKEVDKALQEKISALVKVSNDEREGQLSTLHSLYEQLEKFENQKKELLITQEAEAKEFIPSQKTLNECGSKLSYVDKIIRETKGKIDVVFKKLTTYPESIREIYPFMKLIQG